MNLIPQVKSLELTGGFLNIKALHPVAGDLDPRLLSALKKLPCDPEGTVLEISLAGDSGEGYVLRISPDRITIEADSPAGAFYGIQTLRQLFQEEQVPCLVIQDRPDFSYRGFYHDVTRGKICTVASIKKLIDDMAYYKLNSLQLYVEHVFEFEETKGLWPSTGYLTKAEIREVGAYCHQHFIDFVPSLSTFGHLYELLQQPQYHHLRTQKDYAPAPNLWRERMLHHTIDPLHPESIKLVQSLIDQYAPCFDSEYFNICCDETFDLKRYQDEGLDVGQIYVDFVKKVIAHAQSKGKTVMMWADILLEHPKSISDMSDDIFFLNWYYHDDPIQMENKISLFANSGKKQIVCPGTSTWSRLCPKLEVAEYNIARMIEFGHQYGAAGVLNTNWGDWGNPCSLELAMYGLVLGAEKSWSAATVLDEYFYRAVNSLLFGSPTGIQALKAVSALQRPVSWRQFTWNYLIQRYQADGESSFISEEEVQQVQKAYLQLAEKLNEETWANDEYRQELLLAAEGICVMAELSAKMARYPLGRVTDTEQWLRKYSEKWLAKNKPSELYRIEEMFIYCETQV